MNEPKDVDDELRKVVRDSLKQTPVWNNLISTMEAEIIKLFEGKGEINVTKTKLAQPEIIELVNKLIYEYMDWMGYKLTGNAFKKESGTEFNQSDYRKQVTSSLDIEDNDQTSCLPLLTVLISMYKNKNGDKEAN